jgi:hypothetical protein
MLAGISNGGMYKGHRYFIGFGFFNVSGLSSSCCAGFLEQFKMLTKPPFERLTEKQHKQVLKKLKELSDSSFEEYMDELEKRIKEKEQLSKVRTNRMGRSFIKSNARGRRIRSPIVFLMSLQLGKQPCLRSGMIHSQEENKLTSTLLKS